MLALPAAVMSNALSTTGQGDLPLESETIIEDVPSMAISKPTALHVPKVVGRAKTR